MNPQDCDRELGVKIKFKICNVGDADFSTNATSTIKVEEDAVDISMKNLVIPPGQCRKLSKMKLKFDTCDEKRDYDMSFEIEGSDCHVESKTIRKYSAGICKSEEFFITEVAYPNDHSWNGKYVEIYNPECAGKVIGDGVNIVRYPGEVHRHSPKSYSLQGMTIREDGFFLICSKKTGAAYGTNDICDLIADDVGPKMPHDAFEITKDGKVIDAYGYPSQGDEHMPVQRAVRNSGTQQLSTFNPSDWNVFAFALTEDMDPREWNA